MQENKIYLPEEDSYFSHPYIDVEEWRDAPLRHYFVHGGFTGTQKDVILEEEIRYIALVIFFVS